MTDTIHPEISSLPFSLQTARILISDSKYSGWKLINPDTYLPFNEEQLQLLPFDVSALNPVINKYFTKDHLCLSTFPPKVLTSPIRSQQTISCILVLEGNRTYGRTENKKRLYYKCVPDDKHLPEFLVPYEPKIEFSKLLKNKYAVIKFDNWNGKYPIGTLIEVIGDTDNLDAFYEYQIYCKSLHESITKFTKDTKTAIEQKKIKEYIDIILQTSHYNIQHDTTTNIFTIDPPNSLDYDDGFAVLNTDNESCPYYTICIYIANVFVWLETLMLWKSFSRRVSTIYLPDRKRPMLPTVLCDSLCSLQKNMDRFAFRMSINICKQSGEIIKDTVEFKNVCCKIKENYEYEHANLLTNPDYLTLFKITQKLDKNTQTSNDVVSYWMVQMNTLCGEILAEKQHGIFRHTIPNVSSSGITQSPSSSHFSLLNTETTKIIKNWQNNSGKYTLCGTELHQTLGVKSYAHITSPIRRLVDLLNQTLFMETTHMITNISEPCRQFIHNWINQLEYVNTAMRSIRKIQIDCEFVRKCFTNPDIVNNVYEGVVFDKVDKNDGTFTYLVYLEKIKMLSRIHSIDEFENYTMHKFKIYLFEDAEKIKQKIKLQYIKEE